MNEPGQLLFEAMREGMLKYAPEIVDPDDVWECALPDQREMLAAVEAAIYEDAAKKADEYEQYYRARDKTKQADACGDLAQAIRAKIGGQSEQSR